MIDRTKYVRSMLVTHLNSNEDEVASELAPSAFDEFNRKDDIGVSEGKFVPFHAVQFVETSVTQEQEEVDNNCDLSCSVMPDPTLTVPQETITVEVGEEFDPMTGVSATDGNNHDITDSVTVEAEVPVNYLMTEDSVDITNENDEPLIGE